jgi:hypothetical protein
MDAEKLRVAREKLTRVFRYLEALNQHRNSAKRQIREQPWNLRLRELPEHPSIQRGGGKSQFRENKERRRPKFRRGRRELRFEGAASAVAKLSSEIRPALEMLAGVVSWLTTLLPKSELAGIYRPIGGRAGTLGLAVCDLRRRSSEIHCGVGHSSSES